MEEDGGSQTLPPKSDKQMCLLERRASSVSPLDMTLAARLMPQSKFLYLVFHCISSELYVTFQYTSIV